MITKPLLPPKSGYVEVEVNSERKYKSISTGQIYSPNELQSIKFDQCKCQIINYIGSGTGEFTLTFNFVPAFVLVNGETIKTSNSQSILVDKNEAGQQYTAIGIGI